MNNAMSPEAIAPQPPGVARPTFRVTALGWCAIALVAIALLIVLVQGTLYQAAMITFDRSSIMFVLYVLPTGRALASIGAATIGLIAFFRSDRRDLLAFSAASMALIVLIWTLFDVVSTGLFGLAI